MPPDTDTLEEKWRLEYDRLDRDFYSLRDYFNRNKKCRCHIDECAHFDSVVEKVLGERTGSLFQSGLDISFRRYYEAMRSD